MWKQRAKDFWVKEGDRNTRYFHQVASGRKKHNRIVGAINPSGETTNNEEEIENCFINYFTSIFSSSGVQDMGSVYEAVQNRLSAEAVMELDRPFSTEEVVTAMKQMHPYKAAGPDGMNPIFYQKY